VTVAGLYDGQNMRQLSKALICKSSPVLSEFDLLVTFNGTQFDLRCSSYFPS